MKETPIDLSSLTDDEYSAIELEAIKRGVSFDEAMKQVVRDTSRRLQRALPPHPRNRLAH